MFLILLKLTGDRDLAAQFMEGHNAWIKAGFDDGVFLLVGSLAPNPGGGILAYNTTRAELEKRVAEDPFVADNIAAPELIEVKPGKADQRLEFLLG